MKPWNQAVCFSVCACGVWWWDDVLSYVMWWCEPAQVFSLTDNLKKDWLCSAHFERFQIMKSIVYCRHSPFSHGVVGRCNMQCSLLFHSSKKSLHSPSFLTHPHLIPLLESWKDLLCWVALMPVAFSFTVFHFLLYVIVYNGWWYFFKYGTKQVYNEMYFHLKKDDY